MKQRYTPIWICEIDTSVDPNVRLSEASQSVPFIVT